MSHLDPSPVGSVRTQEVRGQGWVGYYETRTDSNPRNTTRLGELHVSSLGTGFQCTNSIIVSVSTLALRKNTHGTH